MNRDLKCQKCSRIYRGDGFKGVCTEHCFDMKIKEIPVERVNPFIKIPDRSALTNEQIKINEINKRWVEREIPVSNPQDYKKLERKRAWYEGDGSWTKRFNHIRG